jgi:hypothetical protein
MCDKKRIYTDRDHHHPGDRVDFGGDHLSVFGIIYGEEFRPDLSTEEVTDSATGGRKYDGGLQKKLFGQSSGSENKDWGSQYLRHELYS